MDKISGVIFSSISHSLIIFLFVLAGWQVYLTLPFFMRT